MKKTQLPGSCREEGDDNGNPTISIPRTLAFFPTLSSLQLRILSLMQLPEVILWVQDSLWMQCVFCGFSTGKLGEHHVGSWLAFEADCGAVRLVVDL